MGDSSTAGVRAAALKQYNGQELTQNEKADLARATSQAGAESEALGRIMTTGKD